VPTLASWVAADVQTIVLWPCNSTFCCTGPTGVS